MKENFNFPCYANFGRSEPARLAALSHLAKQDLMDQYGAISSGCGLDDIKAGKVSAAAASGFVRMALERGDVYDAEQAVILDRALREGDDKIVSQYFPITEKRFHDEEAASRQIVLPEFGLNPADLKNRQDQLVALDDVVAVFSLDQKVYDKAIAIHDAAGYVPVDHQKGIGTLLARGDQEVLIVTLSAYAHDNPEAAIPNAFGKTQDDYRRTVEAIVQDVPLAIDRFVAER